MDFVGGKITDATSVGTTLSTAQVGALTGNQLAGGVGTTGYAIPCSLGCLAAVVSDNTMFAVGWQIRHRAVEDLRRVRAHQVRQPE